MSPPSFAILAVLAAGADVSATNSPSTYWIEAAPDGPEETALRNALAKGGFGGPAAAVDALRQVSVTYPGTVPSGLAQLAAGLALLEGPRPAEAVPFLTHPDIQRTLLFDHALLGLGRAQEAGDQAGEAARSYLAAAGEAKTPVACTALLRAADALVRAGTPDPAIDALGRAMASCPEQAARIEERLGEIQEERGAHKAAAEAFDQLDRDYPASTQAREAAARLRALSPYLPAAPPPQRLQRELAKGQALLESGHSAEAVAVLRLALVSRLSAEDADLVRVRLAEALQAGGRFREAEISLVGLGAKSPYVAEASFQLARLRARKSGTAEAYEAVAERFPGTPWGEEALLSLANHYQRDARDEEALPYYRRLLAEYPEGRYVERATWRTTWADYKAGRYEQAAQALERVVRLRPAGAPTPAFLYWAGRSRAALGQIERARQLFEETVQRYKYAYHGLRAREWLARLAGSASSPPPAMAAASADSASDIPERAVARVRQLLLIDRLDEAEDELRTLPFSPRTQGTIAWIEWKCGRLRPAILAMKRACPEWVGEGGDHLPPEVWRILFPLGYEETLKAKAAEEGLDPALMAALILQESTFDAQALSRAGARGLMQVIPATGIKLARDLGVRFQSTALNNPKISMDFGARYLRQMMDRYDGQVERVLAAYNAGPHRVDAWTALRPDMPAEEFVESIPFTETRYYVMTVLAGREQYRRLYGLEATPSPATSGARP